MPRQIREILTSVRETGDRGRNTGAPGKYGRSGNLTFSCRTTSSMTICDACRASDSEYLKSNNGVLLKSGSGSFKVIKSGTILIDHIRLSIISLSYSVSIVTSCTIFKIFDVEEYSHMKI